MSLAFKPRSYLIPSDEAELARLLREHGDSARIIAGGTGIYEIAHRGLLSELEVLIDIRKLALSYVILEGQILRVGAATTMSTLARSEEIQNLKLLACVSDALKAIQPLQVKNVASVGGSICTALPFFDLPVALLSIEARVSIGPGGRTENLSDFIKGYFQVSLNQGEFVREILVPLSSGKNRASAFQKFGLTHDDWALVNCGASASLDEGKISTAVIVFGGGVGEKPVRATNVERSLLGLEARDEIRIKEAFEEMVPKDIEPISDIRSSSEYRLRLAKVIGRRTLLQAFSRV